MPSLALCYRPCVEESLAWGHRVLVSLKREGHLVYEGKDDRDGEAFRSFPPGGRRGQEAPAPTPSRQGWDGGRSAAWALLQLSPPPSPSPVEGEGNSGTGRPERGG